jgi:hypothetical protein
MKHQAIYEQAILHGMLIYNDLRAVGYLKPNNFRYKTANMENSKIFDILSRVPDYSVRNAEFEKAGGSYINTIISLLLHKGYMSDLMGVNTPKYALLMLENIFKESIKDCLKRLSEDALHSQIVQNVYAETELSTFDCFDLAENILAYFQSINFKSGVLVFEELIQSIDARVKQINQKHEVEMLTSRLKRHCDDANRQDYLPFLDTIKAGITA